MFNINDYKTNKWLRRGLCLTIILGAIACFVWKIISAGVPQYDFNIFYYAFDKVFHQDNINLLYDHHSLVAGVNRLGYRVGVNTKNFYGYPPQFALLLSPFSLLGFKIGKWVWFCMSNVLYFIGILLFIRVAYKGNSRLSKLLLIAFSFVNGAFFYDIFWGQTNRFIFFLIALTFYLVYIKKSYWLAGIPLGLVIIFKVTPILLIGLFIMRKNWKTIIATFITTIVLTIFTAFFTGYDLIWKYCTKYLWSLNKLNMENGDAPWNSSFNSIMRGITSNHKIESLLFMIFVVVLVSVSVYTMSKVKQNVPSFDIAIFTLLVLLLSPTIEVHHLVLALFAELAIISTILENIEQNFKDDLNRKISLIGIISYLSIALIIVLSILPAMFVSYFVILLLSFVNIIYLYYKNILSKG